MCGYPSLNHLKNLAKWHPGIWVLLVSWSVSFRWFGDGMVSWRVASCHAAEVLQVVHCMGVDGEIHGDSLNLPLHVTRTRAFLLNIVELIWMLHDVGAGIVPDVMSNMSLGFYMTHSWETVYKDLVAWPLALDGCGSAGILEQLRSSNTWPDIWHVTHVLHVFLARWHVFRWVVSSMFSGILPDKSSEDTI